MPAFGRLFSRQVVLRFNGLQLKMNSTSLLAFVIMALCLLTIPMIFVYNNLMFNLSYEDLQQLDDDFIAEYGAYDERLIAHIRKYYLDPPADRSQPYSLLNMNYRDYSHKKQSLLIDKILDEKKNGFFVEAGAYDGETYSNSLFFERYRNWTGLLVEPDFANQKRLLSKKRKAWLLRGCLEGTMKAKKYTLYGAMDIGGLEEYMTIPRKLFMYMWRPVKRTNVWCFPLVSALLAVNQTHVDYMVLDIEGSEMPVLKTIPTDTVDITVLQIEYSVFSGAYWNQDQSQKRLEAMRNFMKQQLPQYKEHSTIALDIVYVKQQPVI